MLLQLQQSYPSILPTCEHNEPKNRNLQLAKSQNYGIWAKKANVPRSPNGLLKPTFPPILPPSLTGVYLCIGDDGSTSNQEYRLKVIGKVIII